MEKDLYRSAKLTLNLPKRWEPATHPDFVSIFPTDLAVKMWEIGAHNNAIVEAEGYGVDGYGLDYNSLISHSKYFNKDLKFEPAREENGMKKWAYANGYDPERFYLHVEGQDAYINPYSFASFNASTYKSLVGWSGYFWQIGYTRYPIDQGVWLDPRTDANWNWDIFQLAPASNHYLYLIFPEKFASASFRLATGGIGCELQWEYASGKSDTHQFTQWSPLTLSEDTTNNFSQDGRIEFTPPTDWVDGHVNPSWSRPGLYHGQIADGLFYMVRVKLVNTPDRRPIFNGIRTDPWYEILPGSVLGTVATAQVLDAGLNADGTTTRVTFKTDVSPYQTTFNRFYLYMPRTGITRRILNYYTLYRHGQLVQNVQLEGVFSKDDLPLKNDVVEFRPGPLSLVMRIPAMADDLNGDGYVDDAELAQTPPGRTGRFKHWSRLSAPHRMFRSTASGTLPNLFDPVTQDAYVAYWQQEFRNSPGCVGYMVDDLRRMMGSELGLVNDLSRPRPVLDNGMEAHLPETNAAYVQKFIETLDRIRNIEPLPDGRDKILIGGNNVDNNPWFEEVYLPFREPLDWFLAENVIKSGMSIGGAKNLNKMWWVPAMAAKGRFVTLNTKIMNCRVASQGNNAVNWARDKRNVLVLHYLFQNYDHANKKWWNSVSFSGTVALYGSNNTRLTEHPFYYEAGIPATLAYFVDEINLDIGLPMKVPGAYRPLIYTTEFRNYEGAFNAEHVIGTSISDVLNDPAMGPIPVMPNHVFYLWSQGGSAAVPADSVLARAYGKKGAGQPDYLVVYRTSGSLLSGGARVNYLNSSIQVPLPGRYSKLLLDGTWGEPSETLSIQGMEGAILKRVP